MFEALEFVNNIPHIAEVLTLVLAAKGLAMAIVNLTPTPQDDGVVKTVYGYIEMAAGIITKRAKQ